MTETTQKRACSIGFVVVLGFKRERSNEHVLGFVVVLGFKRERSNEHVLGFVVGFRV